MSKQKWIPHIVKEGSLDRVPWWDGNGRHCSEPTCELNRRCEDEIASLPPEEQP